MLSLKKKKKGSKSYNTHSRINMFWDMFFLLTTVAVDEPKGPVCPFVF